MATPGQRLDAANDDRRTIELASYLEAGREIRDAN
jgi:hypothetical protein